MSITDKKALYPTGSEWQAKSQEDYRLTIVDQGAWSAWVEARSGRRFHIHYEDLLRDYEPYAPQPKVGQVWQEKNSKRESTARIMAIAEGFALVERRTNYFDGFDTRHAALRLEKLQAEYELEENR